VLHDRAATAWENYNFDALKRTAPELPVRMGVPVGIPFVGVGI
jgi:hypothetical protein